MNDEQKRERQPGDAPVGFAVLTLLGVGVFLALAVLTSTFPLAAKFGLLAAVLAIIGTGATWLARDV